MRRWIVLPILALALVALTALPASAQTITFTVEGTTSPGETVTVACPPHHHTPSGVITFYPSKRSPREIATTSLETIDPTSATAVTPRGAHYYRATVQCLIEIISIRFEGRFEAAGEQVTLLCPPETPYLWSVSPTSYFGDDGESFPLDQEIIRDPTTGQPYGVSFIAPGPGTWFVDLNCSAVLSPWEPT